MENTSKFGNSEEALINDIDDEILFEGTNIGEITYIFDELFNIDENTNLTNLARKNNKYNKELKEKKIHKNYIKNDDIVEIIQEIQNIIIEKEDIQQTMNMKKNYKTKMYFLMKFYPYNNNPQDSQNNKDTHITNKKELLTNFRNENNKQRSGYVREIFNHMVIIRKIKRIQFRKFSANELNIKHTEKYLKLHNIKEIECMNCKISKILETIHSGLMGSIDKSVTSKSYILTFLDEYSRKSWIKMVLTNYCFNNTTDKGKYTNNPKETSQVLIRQEPTITDWKRILKDKKSTSGQIILMGKNSISKYISSSECMKKVLWIRSIIIKLLNIKKQITIFTDSLSSMTTIVNCELNSKLNHINIKFSFNKDNLKNKIIALKYMFVNTLTKNIIGPKMIKFTNIIFDKTEKIKFERRMLYSPGSTIEVTISSFRSLAGFLPFTLALKQGNIIGLSKALTTNKSTNPGGPLKSQEFKKTEPTFEDTNSIISTLLNDSEISTSLNCDSSTNNPLELMDYSSEDILDSLKFIKI
ncbi:hypothetical protein H8356DRAFT_1328688 [Neocallimastix lanati (nom. inval.)]|nr:hypothetical protein H8356DRAFT_1328688 [Neocallimastix sp. JGI-2020a]